MSILMGWFGVVVYALVVEHTVLIGFRKYDGDTAPRYPRNVTNQEDARNYDCHGYRVDLIDT